MKAVYGYEPAREGGVQVQCIPLYTYLMALGVSEVDYFSLDVEGADLAVLKTIPFDKVTFKVERQSGRMGSMPFSDKRILT
jgi:hypothetical protein